MDSELTIGVVTPVARWEPEYLTELGASLAALADVTGAAMQWSLAVDSPAVDAEAVQDTAKQAAPTLHVTARPCPPQTPTGPGSTRNRALARVDAEWLLTIDADDTVIVDGMVQLLDAVRSRPDIMWAAGRANDVDPAGAYLNAGPADMLAPGIVPRGSFFACRVSAGSPPFSPSATVVRTDCVRRVGGWPERWMRTEDSALWSVLDAWYTGVWVPVPALNYRKHPASITHAPSYRGSAPELMPRIAEFVRLGRTNNIL